MNFRSHLGQSADEIAGRRYKATVNSKKRAFILFIPKPQEAPTGAPARTPNHSLVRTVPSQNHRQSRQHESDQGW